MCDEQGAGFATDGSYQDEQAYDNSFVCLLKFPKAEKQEFL